MQNYLDTIKAISLLPYCQVCMAFWSYADGWVILYQNHDSYSIQASDSSKPYLFLWDMQFRDALVEFKKMVDEFSPISVQ